MLWYAGDTGKKIKSVFKAKGLSGKHVAFSCPYGYLKDEKDGNHWIVDVSKGKSIITENNKRLDELEKLICRS